MSSAGAGGRAVLTRERLQALGARVARAARGARDAPPQAPLVCILDLNGVLLERLQTGTPKHRDAVHAARATRPPDALLGGRSLWLRPYAHLLLRYVRARFNLALWSSASAKTVDGLLSRRAVLKGTNIERKDFVFIRDRRHCRPDPGAGRNGVASFATLKPLDVIWRDARCRRLWHPANTVIIDDSPSKTRVNPDNAISIPEYTARNADIDYNSDETLLWTALYLEHLATFSGPFSSSEPGLAPTLRNDIRMRMRSCGTLQEFIGIGKRLSEARDASVNAFIPVSEVPPLEPPILDPSRRPNVNKRLLRKTMPEALANRDEGNMSKETAGAAPMFAREAGTEAGMVASELREDEVDDAEGAGDHNRVCKYKEVNAPELKNCDKPEVGLSSPKKRLLHDSGDDTGSSAKSPSEPHCLESEADQRSSPSRRRLL